MVSLKKKSRSTLKENINAILSFCSHFSWAQLKDLRLFIKGPFLSNIVPRFVGVCVSEHFSFVEIIHPPHRCGVARCWLESVTIAQLCPRLATVKEFANMCDLITQFNATEEMFSASRSCGQILATWGCTLSYCNMRGWSCMKGTTTDLRISSWYLCAVRGHQ